MRIAIATLAVVGLGAIGGPAEAKYDGDPCHQGGGAYVLSSPGRVARNAKLWLTEGIDLPASRFRVRGPGVDRIVQRGRWSDFIDLGELGPEARYVVTVPDLGDFELAELETGDADDTTAPGVPELRSIAVGGSARANVLYDAARDDRETADIVGLDVTLSDDTEFIELDDAGGRAYDTLWRGDLGVLDRTTCGPTAAIREDGRACVTIRAIDLAGNRSAPATRCAAVAPASAFPDREAIPLRRFPEPRPAPAPRPLDDVFALFVGWYLTRAVHRLRRSR